jgi:hypothetical protein
VVASRDHWHQRSALAALARERHEAFGSEGLFDRRRRTLNREE